MNRIEPLWKRALDARRREQMIASMKPGPKHTRSDLVHRQKKKRGK